MLPIDTVFGVDGLMLSHSTGPSTALPRSTSHQSSTKLGCSSASALTTSATEDHLDAFSDIDFTEALSGDTSPYEEILSDEGTPADVEA